MEKGVLTKVQVLVPAGHMALAGLRILYGIRQIAPARPGSWLRGDDERVEWDELFELPEVKTKLVLEAYNDDVVYPHTFFVRFVIQPRAVALWQEKLAKFIEFFSRLVGLK